MNMKKKNLTPYILITPALIFITVFLLYPMLTVFYYSFQHYNISLPLYNGFAGLENFKELFTEDPVFWKSFWNSIIWVVSQVGGQLVIGMMFALILNQTFKYRGVIRALVFIPWAISGVLASTIWVLMYNENMGVINDLLMKIGIINEPKAFLAGSVSAFVSVIITELWRGIPFFTITLLAGLQSIPEELYEAAKVDGSNKVKTFFYITLPHLKGIIVLTTILRVAWEFNNVDVIYNLTGGGPVNSTTTLGVYAANLALKGNRFGYGSALIVVTFLILIIFTLIYWKSSKLEKE